MSRLGGLTSLLILALSTGCAVGPQRAPDAARRQRDEPGERCRGELLLVAAPRPDHDRTVGMAHGVGVVGVGRRAVDAAREFTVAVRAQRDTPPSARCAAVFALEEQGDEPGLVLIEGTGVVIDRSGLILTNHHVVRGASVLEVWVGGIGWLPARMVGTDWQSDLAVILVDVVLPAAARWADVGDLRVGQAVAALGYTPGGDPGEGPEALFGRLTGLHRSLQHALDPIQDSYYGDLLESTVRLEEGHSGGPLIDQTGAVVGINTASVAQPSSGRRNGYAIRASAQVQSVIAALAQGREVSHGYLGVLVCTPAGRDPGVLVEQVVPGGPADCAGVRPADVIVRLAGSPIYSAAQLAEAVRSGPAGRLVRLGLRRGRQSIELTCTLHARPSFR